MRKIRLEDLTHVSCKVQLFNKHLYNLRDGRAYRVIPDYSQPHNGAEIELFDTDIASIFPQIKLIWSGQTIVAKWTGSEVLACPKQRTFRLERDERRFSLHKEALAQEEIHQWQQALNRYWKTHLAGT